MAGLRRGMCHCGYASKGRTCRTMRLLIDADVCTHALHKQQLRREDDDVEYEEFGLNTYCAGRPRSGVGDFRTIEYCAMRMSTALRHTRTFAVLSPVLSSMTKHMSKAMEQRWTFVIDKPTGHPSSNIRHLHVPPLKTPCLSLKPLSSTAFPR